MDDFPQRCLRVAVCIWICAGTMYAGQDMSLPDHGAGKNEIPGGSEVRLVTPPLLGAFPAPDGAMRGLAYDGQYLWAANSGDGNSLYGSKLYKLDPDSGTVLSTFVGPSEYSCGLAWDGEFLWYSSYITGVILQLDIASMTVLKSFTAPTTHPFDLAWDGAFLYAVRGNQPYISVIDTSSGLEVDSIAATYSSPNVRPFGLEFLSRGAPQLLASDGNYGSNLVNAWNFYAMAWVDQWAATPAVYPSGLAHDPATERLWVSCYERDSIYVYDVSQVGMLTDGAGIAAAPQIEVHPNPFSNTTRIRYSIQDSRYSMHELSLSVYDASGRLVRHFDPVSSIQYQVSVFVWDGRDSAGRVLPAGIYFIRVPAINRVVKLLKLRQK
ncbi:T9SS type A sorting domain-containing protein [candidate division WOR-3 bacterium]|nr:T9SS type A sorting domain-containing protein [candidate division WOR-3 bacterium]